jgi:chromosome segregation ATPase
MIRKLHELEKELERVRKFYTNKVQEVERKWEAKYRSIRVGGSGGNYSADIQEKETSHQLKALQREVREKDKELERLQSQLKLKESDVVKTEDDAENDTENKYEATSHTRLVQYVKDLEEQLKSSEETRTQLVQTINNLEIHNNLLKNQETYPLHRQQSTASSPIRFSPSKHFQPPPPEKARDSDPIGAIDELKSRYEAELSDTRDQLIQAEQEAKKLYEARLQEQAQTIAQGKEIQLLHDRLNQAEKERNMLQELASRVPLLESELLRAKQDAEVPKTPSMLQYRSLELKIDTLTQKHQMREQELKLLLAQATQSNQLEQLKLKRMYEDMIAVKNQEIKQFQRQLDEILEELERLRESPP